MKIRHDIAVILGLSLTTAAQGQFSFTEIVRTGDTIPGTSETYESLQEPALDGSTIAFRGRNDTAGINGIYGFINGVPTTFADNSTPIPGETGNLGTFNDLVAVDGDTVQFISRDNVLGVYTFTPSGLSTLVNTNTPLPGGLGPFTSISTEGNRRINGSTALRGSMGTGNRGVFTATGNSLTLVADRSTPIPSGTGNFSSFNNPITNAAGQVVFIGDDGIFTQEGVYTDRTGSLTMVADLSVAVPNGTDNFSSFFSPWFDGDNIYFEGRDANNQGGIYASLAGGPVVMVVDESVTVPGGTDTFTSLIRYAVVDGTLVFTAQDQSDDTGLYFQDLDAGGPLTRVIGTGDTLNGVTVDRVSIDPYGFDGRNLGFTITDAGFTTKAMFTTVVPEPTSLALLGIGGLLACSRRRR